MEYDGDLHIPKHYLVQPPAIEHPMGEILAGAHVTQLAISETQKFGHVTYFWNGNKSAPLLGETWVEVPSDTLPFEERPWMKSAEITDRLIAELRTGKHRHARVNYANGDMVGHTGSIPATIKAVETVDECLARVMKAAERANARLLITADHGNCEMMIDPETGGPHTAHTTNPVPFIIVDRDGGAPLRSGGALCDVGPTLLTMLNLEQPAEMTGVDLRLTGERA